MNNMCQLRAWEIVNIEKYLKCLKAYLYKSFFYVKISKLDNDSKYLYNITNEKLWI